MNIKILIEKLEKLTNKKVILEDNKLYYSKYIKPIKLDERLLKKKEEFDKNIVIKGNELTYKGNLGWDDDKIVNYAILLKYYKNYIINVKGAVDINNLNLKEIEIQFGSVDGAFDCSWNYITNLKGCPFVIGNDFSCTDNELTSLDGCPKKVGNSFWCRNNSKKFTKEEVKELCEVKGAVFS